MLNRSGSYCNVAFEYHYNTAAKNKSECYQNQIPLKYSLHINVDLMLWLHLLLTMQRLATDCFRPHKTSVYTSDSRDKPTAKTTSDSDQQRQYVSLTLQV